MVICSRGFAIKVCKCRSSHPCSLSLLRECGYFHFSLSIEQLRWRKWHLWELPYRLTHGDRCQYLNAAVCLWRRVHRRAWRRVSTWVFPNGCHCPSTEHFHDLMQKRLNKCVHRGVTFYTCLVGTMLWLLFWNLFKNIASLLLIWW